MTLTPLDEREQDLLRKTMGLRCRQARERLGLSQRALARVMQRSPSWVREVEAGDQWAPPYLLAVLARAAGVTPRVVLRRGRARPGGAHAACAGAHRS